MTWTEVEALDREQVIVVPVGGTEQHGPSLPLGTSTRIANAFAWGLDHRMPEDVIVVPTIGFGVSGMDKAFAGTVDLGADALMATLRAVVASLTRHRFRRFLFVVGGFEDTCAATRLALRAIKDEHPNLQLALWEGLKQRAAFHGRASMLFEVHPELIKGGLDSTITKLRLHEEARFAKHFISDTDETTVGGFGSWNPSVLEEPPTLIAEHVESLCQLVGLMRAGRVYLQSPPEA